MAATPKDTRKPTAGDVAESKAVYNDFARLFLNGMERVAEVQKKALDLAVQHNGEFINVCKQAAEKLPGVPRVPMLEVMVNAFALCADTQKSAIDLAVEQSQVWTDVFKDRATVAGQSTESVTNLAKQAVERSAAIQKKALEDTAAQTKAAVDAVRQQFGFAGSPADSVAESFHRGVDTIVEAQKELLDLVTH